MQVPKTGSSPKANAGFGRAVGELHLNGKGIAESGDFCTELQ